MSRTVEQRFEDILEAIDRCFEYQKFLSNPEMDAMALDAIIRNIEIIGEAIKHLPDSFKAEYSEIPWHEAVGMRNFLAHQYFGVLEEQIKSVIDSDLKVIQKGIQENLAS